MMSVYEKQFKNAARNSLQNSQSSKNCSKCKLSHFESPEFQSSSSYYKAEEKYLCEITGWRRASLEDENAIKRLQTFTGKVANTLYRKKRIVELIEKSYLSIVQFDKKGDLVSFSAYDSYPNIPAISPSWDHWLTINYRIEGITASNALFIHYMVWQPKYEKTFLPLLLETLFIEFVFLKYIIVIKPPKANIPDFYSKYFIPVLPPGLEDLKCSSVQLLFLCLRSSVIQPLSIRTAFEQEFDIITSVIDDVIKNTEKNTSYVLDFLSFVLQEDNKTLICEFEGQMAGIMTLNLKFDLNVLNEGFELAPFNGLRKRETENEADEHLKYESYSLPQQSFNELERSRNALLSSEFLFSEMNWEMILSKLRSTDILEMEQSGEESFSNSQYSLFSFYTVSSKKDLDKNYTSQEIHEKRSKHLTQIEDIDVMIRTSDKSMARFIAPKYSGHSNAFVIDFFAIDCNKVDEKIFSFDFLEAAFKIIPDREYCILLIPTDLLPFPLLDLFVRITPRPMSTIKQELYLCHKNSLSVMSMSVRRTKDADLAPISNFLKWVDKGDIVYQDILDCCSRENNNFKSFLLTVGETIVGVSLINSQNNIEHLRMYFEVTDSTLPELDDKEDHPIIKHLIVSPLYRNHARFFVRDIMRLIGVNCLYYVYKKPRKSQCNLLSVLEEFAPIKPRRKVRPNNSFSQVPFPFSEEKNSEDSFSLYFLTTRLCGFHKTHINIIIVVVGASRTAKSFLENLIFGSDHYFLNYNNLICVTPQDSEIDDENTDLQDLMFPIRDNSSKKYTSRLSLEKFVSFIYGIMTGINRTEKYIIINNRAVVKYDYLILTCGLQYLLPTPKAKENIKKCSKNYFRGSLSRFLLRAPEQRKIFLPNHPNNMFIINTTADAHNALRILKSLMSKLNNVSEDEKKIIVYGHDLHVFLTIHTLLKLGIPGEFIAFVEPFPTNTKSVTLFNDYSIDQAVLESVKECKVNYYTDYLLYDWSLSPEDYITTIKFHSRRKQLVIPCLAFFPFLEKLVSDVTFNACNNAGLVYDGKLVINHNFRTNDSYIYAAGPFTKYARRYYASDCNHEYYNSREVGQKLAEIVRGRIDPTKEDNTKEESDLVPLLKAPVLLYCQLPGDNNLFILRKPGKEIDKETAYNFYDYGEDLTTGDCQMKNGFGYFRLHLDPEGFVESIICYTKDKIDYINLSSLYGLHESILNNLVFRYDKSMISDFFEYFRQPWALALFHENFQRLRDRNYEAFIEKSPDSISFSDKIVGILKKRNWKQLASSEWHQLEEEYLKSEVHQKVKNNLLQFLEYYHKDLPMYATPSTLNVYLKGDQNRNFS